MAGEIQLNGTTALTESAGAVTLNNVDSATNRTNLGLGSAATSASTAFASSSTTITAGTGLTGGGDLSTNRTVSVDYASTSEVQGTHTTGSITSGNTSLTVASGSGISNGDYVVGEGITPGTTVSSGGGTTSITLSANAGATLSSDPVSFFKSNKVLSPGLVAGGLCRAWVNFDGVNQTIRSSFNISSISYATGSYTINFTTAMSDTNYCVCGSVNTDAEANTRHFTYNPNFSTGSVNVYAQVNYGSTEADDRADASVISVAIFR